MHLKCCEPQLPKPGSARESYGDEAIGYVQRRRESGLCTMKCKICPEHKVRSSSYVTMVIDEYKCEIVSCQCLDCATSAGGCKHAVAFLMWTHRRTEALLALRWNVTGRNQGSPEVYSRGKKRKITNCELLKCQPDFKHSDVRQFSFHNFLMQASDELNNDVDQVLESLTATLNDNVLAEIETATRKQ
uniref:SFRICE_032268 n=1 Tax=Spodoptera frugiperda TaxID=7108 RepID=A0A2H1V6G5_SPOFR